MKINKTLFKILIYIMLIGGIMGVVKILIPSLEWLSFRKLLGMVGTYQANAVPLYAAAYGVIMAVLEIISAVLLLTKRMIGINFTLGTLCINVFGCIVAILIGDILAIGSLLIRLFAIYIVVKSKDIYLL